MDGRSNKDSDPTKLPPDLPQENRNVPIGLIYRELGHKQKQRAVPLEFQAAAEDKLVTKQYEELRCELPGASRSTFLMVFSPDGKKVASTHGNHNVYVTDLTTGKNVNTLSGHPRTPWCIAFHPSSNQILASGCLGGQVRVWDLHGGSEMWMAEGQTVIASLAFHPTDRLLVIATYNELHFWDWSQPEPFAKCYTNNEKEKVRYVAFDQLGHKLITGISNAPPIQTQWDRVTANPPPQNQSTNNASSSQSAPNPSNMMPPERERRITICYRSLVEQYEQLVQRYFDLSRSRAIPTMDRGTDPMDLEADASTSGARSRDGAGPSGRGRDGNNGSASINLSDIASAFNFPPRFAQTRTTSMDPPGASSDDRAGPRGCLFEPGTVLTPAVSFYSGFDYPVEDDRPANGSDGTQDGSDASNATRDIGVGPTDRVRVRIRAYEVTQPMHTFTTFSYSRRPNDPNVQIPEVTEYERGSQRHPDGTWQQHCIFSRLHTQAQPSSPVPPERPRRFFVSQRSAFQPRTPRTDQSSSVSGSEPHPQPQSQFHPQLHPQLQAQFQPQPQSQFHPQPPPHHSQIHSQSQPQLHLRRHPQPYHSQLQPPHSQPPQPQAPPPLPPPPPPQFHPQPQPQNEPQAPAPQSHSHSEAETEVPAQSQSQPQSQPQPPPRNLSRYLFRRRTSNTTESSDHFDAEFEGSVPAPMQHSRMDMTDVGVRYGIQLLSRHIDNMQRLCRARLEILQLQQIRRMWEDLQRQIRSLHVAVRESTIALTGTSPASRGVEDNAEHVEGPSEGNASHIPSVSQMMELARISDNSPGQDVPEPERGQNVDSRRETNAGSHSINCMRNLIEFQRMQEIQQRESYGIDSGTSDSSPSDANSERNDDGANVRNVQSSDGHCALNMQLSSPFNHEDDNNNLEEAINTQNGCTETVHTGNNALACSVQLSSENSTSRETEGCPTSESNSPASDLSGDTSQPPSSHVTSRQNRGFWLVSTMSLTQPVPTRVSTTSTAGSPAVTTPSGSSRSNCHLLQQRLLRISRKVYLRRPRLFAVAPRSLRRQPGGSHSSLSRNHQSGPIGRHNEMNRRPWFMQSMMRPMRRSTNTASQVGSTNSGDTPDASSSNSNLELRSNSGPIDYSLNRSQAHTSSQEDVQAGPSGMWSVKRVMLDDCGGSSAPSASKRTDSCAIEVNRNRTENSDNGNEIDPSLAKSVKARQDVADEGNSTQCNQETGIGLGTTPKTEAIPNSAPSTSRDCTDNSGSRHHETSTSESLRSMIVRLERLVQQQREQRERLRNERMRHESGQNRRTNMWGLREGPSWFRAEINSGSDSDSNPESERSQSWGQLSAEERLSSPLQNDMYRNERYRPSSSGTRRSQLDQDWEWTRESTRLRARQVLSLMVESLTQFFEENGLSNNTPHAVLDEQIYNLYVLLQLALELTDLLLAQLVSTRRELEHQWVHRLRSPVALDASLTGDQQAQNRERDRRERGRQVFESSAYRRLFRHRLPNETDGSGRTDRVSGRGRGECSRRLSSRMMNCLARHSRLSPHSGASHHSGLRCGRGLGIRSVGRVMLSRGEGQHAASRTPSHTLPGSSRRSGVSDNSTTITTVTTTTTTTTTTITTTPSNNSCSSSSAPGGIMVRVQQYQTPSSSNASGSTTSNLQSTQQQDAFTVPLVRVNDILIPDTSVLNQPRTRPQSPPPHPNSPFRNPFSQAAPPEHRGLGPWPDLWPYVPSSSWRPRFLHPRYMGPNFFHEEPEEVFSGENFNLIRDTVIITDAPMSPNHRIQVWDFSKFNIPDISNTEKNVIVPECKIHNDASVDVSKDGRLLVTLLPSGRLSITTKLGVYSLEWESLGQCLYTTSFDQSAVSVSLSPASRHLLVGLATRRVALLPNDRQTMAQIFRLEGGRPNRSNEGRGKSNGARGRLCHLRDIEQLREQGYMSLNCIRWAPGPGQGFVYGTNTGQLKVLR